MMESKIRVPLTEEQKLTPPSPEQYLPGVHRNTRVEEAQRMAAEKMEKVKLQHATEALQKVDAGEELSEEDIIEVDENADNDLANNNVIEVVDEAGGGHINQTNPPKKTGFLTSIVERLKGKTNTSTRDQN